MDRWREPHYFGLTRTQDDPAAGNAALDEVISNAPPRAKGFVHGIGASIIGTARELVLRIDVGRPVLSIIGFTLDSNHLDLVLSRTFDIIDADDNDLKRHLAFAAIFEVPVYPDDEVAAEVLVRLHTELLTTGFVSAEDERRYKVAKQRAIDFDGSQLSESEAVDASVGAADLLIYRAQAAIRESEREEATQVLATLRSGIEQLSNLLERDARDESALQACLTSYPILFGLDYQRVIPKHPLGGEYEMDYALVRHSGLIDLVEIEPSSLTLYTRGGNPSKHLVHAEQQVLDWHEWIEAHGEYARSSLPGLLAPRGYVVIGSSRGMTEDQRRRLQRRNIAWRDRIEVYTFETLLDRAKNILAVLVPQSGMTS